MIYIYESWLTLTFIAGSVGSEDQRAGERPSGTAPNCQPFSAKIVNHKQYCFPGEWQKFERERILNAVSLRSLHAHLVRVGTGHCLPFCFHGIQMEKMVSNNKFIKAIKAIFQLEKIPLKNSLNGILPI